MRLAILGACALISASAAAETSPFYMGGSVGMADVSASVTTGIHHHDSEFNWSLHAGWKFNEFFSAELSYLRPNKVSDSIAVGSGTETLVGKFDGIAASSIASWSVYDNLKLRGRLGLLHSSVQLEKIVASGRGRSSKNGTEFLFGAGLSTNVETADVWLEYQYTQFRSHTMKGAVLGISWYLPTR